MTRHLHIVFTTWSLKLTETLNNYVLNEYVDTCLDREMETLTPQGFNKHEITTYILKRLEIEYRLLCITDLIFISIDIYELRVEFKIVLRFISCVCVMHMPHCTCGGQRTTTAVSSPLVCCGC